MTFPQSCFWAARTGPPASASGTWLLPSGGPPLRTPVPRWQRSPRRWAPNTRRRWAWRRRSSGCSGSSAWRRRPGPAETWATPWCGPGRHNRHPRSLGSSNAARYFLCWTLLHFSCKYKLMRTGSYCEIPGSLVSQSPEWVNIWWPSSDSGRRRSRGNIYTDSQTWVQSTGKEKDLSCLSLSLLDLQREGGKCLP